MQLICLQQGSLGPTLTTHVELWVCMCVCQYGQGVGGGAGGATSTITAGVFQDGKPLLPCLRERVLLPTAKITWYLQQVKLQEGYRGRKWEAVGRGAGKKTLTREGSQTDLTRFLFLGLCFCVWFTTMFYHDSVLAMTLLFLGIGSCTSFKACMKRPGTGRLIGDNWSDTWTYYIS